LRWKALYDDGSSLDGGEGRARYTDIDFDRIVRFELLDDDDSVRVGIDLDGGRRLVYRQRTFLNALTGEKERAQIVGWQMNVCGTNIQNILFVFDDGRVECLSRFREEHAQFDKINFLPQEEV
jgi:hypothetical protein